MTEALLLSVIEKVESWLQDNQEADSNNMMFPSKDSYLNVVDNINSILDFLRNEKLVKERSCRLKYLVSDAMQIALDFDEGNLQPQIGSIGTSHSLKVESVQRWFGEVTKRILESGVDMAESSSSSSSSSSIISEINVGEEDYDGVGVALVGLEKDVELLLRRAIFNYGKQGKYCYLITGMVGIGKTTLARQLYNHPTVIERFERRAWVCVSSRDLCLKEVLMKLIHQVVDCHDQLDLIEKMECADNRSLQQMLHQHLQGTRYLIVLDDWPKLMHLPYILNALPNEETGSKLLLTCTSVIEDISNIHEMKTLDCDESWQLFLKTLKFGTKLSSEYTFPEHLEKRGREMLRPCAGLPLAIKEVARQKAEKRGLGTEWDQLLESIDLSATFKLLELFYEKLDPEVKLCFLHLAFFKEDATIREEKLMQIFGIGGMVQYSLDYKLYKESIITCKDYHAFYWRKTYQVNPILHRLSIQKAKEEIGFEILRNDSTGNSRYSQTSPRHRVIICGRDDMYNRSTNQVKHLLSLFFRGGGHLDINPSYWKSFEQLRILDLEDFGLKILPEGIDTLIELRYLGLRNNYILDLPHSLGCLKKLEVLDIAQNFMVDVPDIIWEIGSLRHLYMSDVICWKPLKIDALQNLKALTYVSVDDWMYEVSGLQSMTKLHKLGIEELDGDSDASKLFESLAELKLLNHLILRGYCFKSMPCLDELRILRTNVATLKLDGLLAKLPSADNFPPYISELKLVNSSLEEDPMPVLKKLYFLRNLKLRNAYTGLQMVISHDGFRKLEFLVIEELKNLRNIHVEEGAMSNLEVLRIKNCPNLETLPEKIESMTNLSELEMVTTKRIATKIHNYVQQSGLLFNIKHIDITYKC